MRILIALASSPEHLSGVPRHAINLTRCMLTRQQITEVHLVAAPWQQAFLQDAFPHSDTRLHLHSAPIGRNTLSRNLWFFSQLPKLAATLHAEIVHLAYPVPVCSGAFHCPTVVTLHDLYPYDIPKNFGFPKVLFNRAILGQCLRSVDSIACVSRSTNSRLKTIYPELRQKAIVVYNSVEPPSSLPLDLSPPDWGALPFLLCVAQHRSNKNILLALRVFERLLRAQQLASNMQFLVVGIPGPETSVIHEFISASGLAENVILLSGISEARLQWCYRNCGVLIAPSTLEGFGLPVAEALLAGSRIVCSDIPAFRELGASHCHYVPLGPHAVDAFADAICLALRHERPKPVVLPQLSAEVIAAEYLRHYQSLIPADATHAGSLQVSSSSEERRNPIWNSNQKAKQ